MKLIKKYLNKKIVSSIFCILLLGFSQCGFAGSVAIYNGDTRSYLIERDQLTISTADVDNIRSHLQDATRIVMTDIEIPGELCQLFCDAINGVRPNIDMKGRITCNGIFTLFSKVMNVTAGCTIDTNNLTLYAEEANVKSGSTLNASSFTLYARRAYIEIEGVINAPNFTLDAIEATNEGTINSPNFIQNIGPNAFYARA